MKKGQGLSMNVIIIAAIALLVLVIISVLVLRAGGNVNEGTGCVAAAQGTCQAGSNGLSACESLGGGYVYDPSHGCAQDGEYCCIKLGK